MALSEGDKVSVLALPEGYLEGLSADEAEFMRSAVGGRARVYRILEDGRMEVMLADPPTGNIHFVTLSEEMVAAA